MWRDRWFVLSTIGAGTGRLDLVLFPVLVGFIVLALYRYWITRRGTL